MHTKLIIIISILFITTCGEKKKKVYTQFDTAEVINQKNSNLDDSAQNGGIGFEKFAAKNNWMTNNNIRISGDPKAIKGDTITIVADDVFPPNFRGFGKTNSPSAFGHNGAGGQIAWVDPESGLSVAYLTSGHDRNNVRQGKRGVAISSIAAECAA